MMFCVGVLHNGHVAYGLYFFMFGAIYVFENSLGHIHGSCFVNHDFCLLYECNYRPIL